MTRSPARFALMLLPVAGLLFACGQRAISDEAQADATPPVDASSSTHRALTDDRDFQRLGKPAPGEWLDRFEEPGQTLKQYKLSPPPGRTATRTRFVIQPMGPFSDEGRQVLERAAEFAGLFFDVPVETVAPIDLPPQPDRVASWGPQYLTDPMLDTLRPRLPDDAIGLLGVTEADLYPGDQWNYVFGYASLADRVGVYSIVRYFPQFWGEKASGKTATLALQRTAKVFVHEAGHMYGILHCTDYHCVMNGSNSLDETDRSPLFLCPVDVSKLHWALELDLVTRYDKLLEFCTLNGLNSDADWLKRRLETIRGESS